MPRLFKLPFMQLIIVLPVLSLSNAPVVAQETKPARIGLLRSSEPPAANLAAFRQGMRDRGQIEGKTYVLVPGWRNRGEPRVKDLALAKKLVARGVDLIITVGSRMTTAASRAAPSTPIVMASTAYATRHVKSLAKPDGNITGMSADALRATAKGIELLKKIAPRIRRVAALHRKRAKGNPVRGSRFQATDDKTAKALKIEIVGYPISGTDDFDALFERLIADGVDALSFRTGSGYTIKQRKRMMDAARRAGLPSVSTSIWMVKLGGLVTVGTSRTWLFRRAAAYVDLILKGAKPGELPIERPRSFQVVLNMKTAKALGLTVPNSLLLRADEVIE